VSVQFVPGLPENCKEDAMTEEMKVLLQGLKTELGQIRTYLVNRSPANLASAQHSSNRVMGILDKLLKEDVDGTNEARPVISESDKREENGDGSSSTIAGGIGDTSDSTPERAEPDVDLFAQPGENEVGEDLTVPDEDETIYGETD
jgi:hypothetical protein